ncbi:hypothetical protein D9M68_929630 [compost metagenome]
MGHQVARSLDDLGASLQVGAGAEHLAFAGQDHRAHLVHLGDLVEGPCQLVVEHACQRIDRRRIQRQRCDVIGDGHLELQEVVHDVS